MKVVMRFAVILIFCFSSNCFFLSADTSSTSLLIETGIKLYENGDYEESLKLFDSGLDTIEDEESLITIHKYMALNYIAFNIKEKAYQEFKKIFVINPDFELEERYSPVVMKIYELAKLDSGKSGFLEILSEPAGADVYLDGEFFGSTPLKKELRFGRYFMELKLFGYKIYNKSIVMNSEQIFLDKIKLNETLFFSKFKEGVVLYEKGEYISALEIFFDVLVKTRKFPDVYIMIGLCYSKIPEMEFEGIEWIKKGISKSTEKKKGYMSLYDSYYNVEDYKAALNVLKKIETLENTVDISDWINSRKQILKEKGYI